MMHADSLISSRWYTNCGTEGCHCIERYKYLEKIIIDLPIGFPINNIISLEKTCNLRFWCYERNRHEQESERLHSQ